MNPVFWGAFLFGYTGGFITAAAVGYWFFKRNF